MDRGESISGPSRLSLCGPTAIHDATAAVRAFAEEAGIDSDRVARIAIVVEELVTNLYDHGGLGDEDVFVVELSCDGSGFGLVIVDPGSPFDPRSAVPDRAIPARGGGAGLDLMRAWASHMDYQSSEGLNRLSIRLPGRD